MNSTIDVLNADDIENKSKTLQNLSDKLSAVFHFPELEEHNYRADLWKALENILLDENQKSVHLLCLTTIRILSRERANLNQVLHENLLNLIITYSGLKSEKEIVYENNDRLVEALKCLCNILFNASVPRAFCCRNGIMEGIFKRLQTYSTNNDIPIDVKILDVKLLFIITALNSETRSKVNDEMQGLKHITDFLKIILKQPQVVIEKCEASNFQDKQVDLVNEILKTLFNLTVDYDDDNDEIDLVATLRQYLLLEVASPEKRLELHNHVINLLTNLPEKDLKFLVVPLEKDDKVSKYMIYKDFNMSALHAILAFLQSRFENDPTVSKQHEVLSPVLSLLRKCVGSDRKMRKYLRLQVLPPLEDVHNRPEDGNTYRNYLCRLLTSPITHVRDLAADFIFILCKENVGRMVKYTGYGNAAGMFATRGLLGGKNGDTSKYSSGSEDSDTEEYSKYKDQINPVMGCYQPQRPNPTANMTEEQKEHEAMKLVELMDHLTRTGIVRPCTVGKDGRPKPIDHVLQLQEDLPNQQVHRPDDDD